MRPRRLNHFAVTSALIGFVLSVMWVWSHIGVGATAYALDGIGSVENNTTFQIAAASVTLNTGALLIQRHLDFDPDRNANPNSRYWSCDLFLVNAYSNRFGWSVRVRLWPLIALSCPLPLWWLRVWRQARQRRREGLCRRCGYDLRASADRCPECGEPIHPRI